MNAHSRAVVLGSARGFASIPHGVATDWPETLWNTLHLGETAT